MTSRLDRACAALVKAFQALAVADQTGRPSPGELAGRLSRRFVLYLGSSERLTLAGAALLSLERGSLEKLAEAALHDVRTGPPIPPFATLREEARNWVALAAPGELRAYFSAIWAVMPEVERIRFLKAVRFNQRTAA